MAISAGVAYVDVLPNMSKFAPAVAAQSSASSGALAKLGKTGALALGAIGAGSVVMAADFEKSMRNVNSIAQLPEPAFKKLNDDVLALAGPTAQAPKTLAEGLYDLVSSGFDSAESLKILRESAFAATAGLTTTEVSTKAVSAVLNAYRLPASKAKEVSDQLFRTVDRGVITFEELSTNIGDTLPFASSLGVGLDEVGAATATMTKQGLGASETFTRIRNLLQTMIKPGEDLTAAIKELGYESGEALIQDKGLQGSLEALIGTTDGTKDSVAKLFPNIRALGGALALTGKNSEEAQKDLKGMEDAAGATQRAFEEQSKSLAVQWERLKANLSTLAIRIGNVLLPAVTDAVRWLNEDFGDAFRRAADVVRGLADTVATAFRAVKSWVTGAVADVKRFIGAFLPIKMAVIAVKVALETLKPAAKLTFAVLSGAARIVAAAVRAVWSQVKAMGQIIGNVVAFAANILRGDFAAAWGNVKGAVQGVINLIRGGIQGAIDVAKGAFQTIKDVGVVAFAILSGAAAGLKSILDSVLGILGDIIGALGDAINFATDLANKISGVKTVSPGDLPGKAAGGPVTGGEPYLVGERGMELFVPGVSGRIIPNHRLGAMVAPGAGRMGLTITNWKDGTGYLTTLADGAIQTTRRDDRTRARMGRRKTP